MVIVGLALVLAVVGVTGCTSPGTVNIAGEGGTLRLVSSQQEGIWVNGTGKVTAVPDVAIVRVGVEAQQPSVAEAQAQAAAAMDKVMQALESQGVAEKDIQTQYFNIQKISRWDNEKDEEYVTGYRVTNTVTAKVRDVENAGVVIDAVATAGGDQTRIDGISFTVDDPQPYYVEARAQALGYAKEKAQQLADVAGVKLGTPTYISENTYMPTSNYVSRDMAMEAAPAAGVTTSISPGEIEITTNVQVAYAIGN
jgi:hypothetical protein